MTYIFADTCYWIALLNPRDELHSLTQGISASLSGVTILTSDAVLTELLNSFAEQGPRFRFVVSTAVVVLKTNPKVIVVPQSREVFNRAFDLYRERSDKGWSLTDCSSFLIMRQYGIDTALTYDKHFEQAGFSALLR
jgi:predicted nucleic acid-binding protein